MNIIRRQSEGKGHYDMSYVQRCTSILNPEEKHRPPWTLPNKQTRVNYEVPETIHNLYRINRLWLTITKLESNKFWTM